MTESQKEKEISAARRKLNVLEHKRMHQIRANLPGDAPQVVETLTELRETQRELERLYATPVTVQTFGHHKKTYGI